MPRLTPARLAELGWKHGLSHVEARDLFQYIDALTAEVAALRLSDAHKWELQRLRDRLLRDDPGNFPLIQALEATLREAPLQGADINARH